MNVEEFPQVSSQKRVKSQRRLNLYTEIGVPVLYGLFTVRSLDVRYFRPSSRVSFSTEKKKKKRNFCCRNLQLDSSEGESVLNNLLEVNDNYKFILYTL